MPMWTKQNPEGLFPVVPDPDHVPEASGGNVRVVTVITSTMVVKGQIKSLESLHIDGEVTGSLDLPESRLTVSQSATVEADVRAREIEIMGNCSGDMDATKKITVRKGARLVGDIRTPAVVIEEGAYYKGRIEILTGSWEAQQSQKPAAKTATVVG